MPADVNRRNAVVAIREWQQNQHHLGSQSEDRSVAARLCDGILDVFQEVIRKLLQAHHAEAVPKPIRISLERARGLIALWSDGYGIQDGRLDDVLAQSSSIRRSTLKILSSIASTLLNRLIPLAQISSDKLDVLTVQLAATNAESAYKSDCSDTSSDGFSDAGPDDSIAEVAEDLKTDAQCLMELDPLFRDPVLDLALHKQKHVQDLKAIDWAPEKAYCDKVQQRFPKAEALLVERLGQANWARYLRCQEMRDSPIEVGAQPLQASAADKGDDGTVAANSRYHDSGLGTSLPAASSYAETVMTYGAGDGQKIRIPPLSDEAKKGTPFPCLACGGWVQITNNSAWKRHLYTDLEPYACLEPQCSQTTRSFSNRNNWISHLALDHRYQPEWDAVTCPLCFETTEKGKLAVTTHLARHLEEISLSALPAYPDEDDEDAGFNAEVDDKIESKSAQGVEAPLDNYAVPLNEDGALIDPTVSTMKAELEDLTKEQEAIFKHSQMERLEKQAEVTQARRARAEQLPAEKECDESPDDASVKGMEEMIKTTEEAAAQATPMTQAEHLPGAGAGSSVAGELGAEAEAASFCNKVSQPPQYPENTTGQPYWPPENDSAQPGQSSSPSAANLRFVCHWEGCTKTFRRQCDLE
jgi:hypothetical protein